MKALKFGGTSMADGNVINGVKKIIESDAERRFIVVSAPGKRYSQDVKVTDAKIFSARSGKIFAFFLFYSPFGFVKYGINVEIEIQLFYICRAFLPLCVKYRKL